MRPINNIRNLLGTFLIVGVSAVAAPVTYNAVAVPLALVDSGTRNATLTITDSYSITDLNIKISINHTFDGDLDIFLISPGGTSIELSTDNGAGGDNYTNTIFDDAAATSITAGTAPFTGTFRPETVLNALNGQNINGAWTLRVIDDSAGDTGTILAWSITADGGGSSVPEPASLVLLGSSLCGLALLARRRTL